MPATWATLACALGLVQAGPEAEPPVARGRVVVEALEVRLGPERSAYITATLPRDAEVAVLARAAGGTLAIEPPEGSFEYVPMAALERIDATSARIKAPGVTARAGLAEARLPGPPSGRIEAGTSVQLVARPPLQVGGQTFKAIAPPAGSRRYVTMRGLKRIPDPPSTIVRASRPNRPAVVQPPALGGGGNLEDLRREYEAILARPVEQWDFATLRAHAEARSTSAADDAERIGLLELLAMIERQDRAASAAKQFAQALERTRRADRLVEGSPKPGKGTRPDYDASGLLTPSAKRIAGVKVYALVDLSTGGIAAYLQLPPGLEADSLVGRQVGVSGESSFDETLGGRVVAVRDLMPLD